MGWLYTAHHGTNEEFFSRRWTNLWPRVKAHATVGRMFYAVLECTEPDNRFVPDPDGKYRTMLVIATNRVARRRDGYNFGYKDMCETVGPCEATAPARLLDLLSPIVEGSDTYARDWRERCRSNLKAKSSAARARRSIKPGAKVKLAAPLSFRGGIMLDEFEATTYTRRGKQRLAFRAPNGMLCSIRTRYLASATIS